MPTSDEQLGLDAEREARDAALARAEAASSERFTRWARRVITILARRGQPFNADDVWQLANERDVAAPRSSYVLGALFLAAKREGLIVKVGERPMTRPGSHARPTSVYRGAGATRAPCDCCGRPW